MPDYKMTISRLTIDKLGVKLYDKVSAVIAELVANSYDADATEVTITAPMGEYLATKQGGELKDYGNEIEVRDNGCGIHPDDVNDFYLKVGAERRNDERRGSVSPMYGRKVMGSKGIGKLAPFGICQRIEIITAGGDLAEEIDDKGQPVKGYRTAHFVLDSKDILTETDIDYEPEIGPMDGKLIEKTGTIVKLSSFIRRKVPSLIDLERQMSHRFGIQSPDWRIVLIDALKTPSDPDYSRLVGSFNVDIMDNTRIRFVAEGEAPEDHKVLGPDGEPLPTLLAGFFDEDHSNFYPIIGWVAYSAVPYKDDLMAGVRIYCRGKIAAQTSVFERKAGFSGEHNVRSYLVGELYADWLDETEDLIHTDRRDILWSHEIGQAFQSWGQRVVVTIGKLSRDPMRRKVWDLFKEKGQVEEKINEAFPLEEHKDIKKNAWELMELLGKKIRREEIEEEPGTVKTLVDLGLMFAPHVTLNRTLQKAAEQDVSPLSLVATILRTARIAELASFGRIAQDRINVISKLYTLKDDPATQERDLQKLVHEAPWLIDPQWSPLTSNQPFSTLKEEFQKYYKRVTKQEIILNDFSDPTKRPDFVLSNHGPTLQIIEIKRPGHSLTNAEMGRIQNYVDVMGAFLGEPAHADFRKHFNDYHVTLVCDGLSLTGVHKGAFDNLDRDEKLTWINWSTFMMRTRTAHQAFLDKAEKLKKLGGI